MPPVRWLVLAVIAVNSPYWIKITAADHPDLPVASNGWRPIVGDRYESSQHNIPQKIPQKVSQPAPNNNQQQQQHMTENNAQINRNKEQNKNQGNHNNYNKNGAHLRVNHHGSSGHHTKHVISSHMSKLMHKPTAHPMHKPTAHPMVMSSKMAHSRHPTVNKVQHLSTAKRHKIKQPIRNQMNSHRERERDELIAPAPSSAIGSYAYFNQGPFNIRDTQIGGNKQFSHHDFRTHYNLQPSNTDHLSHMHPTHYTFAKHPSQNELHTPHYTQFFNQNDEFTRNLVPPPAIKSLMEKENSKDEKTVISQSEFNAFGSQEKGGLLTNTQQFILGKPRDDIRHQFPDNVVLQLQNPYAFSSGDGQINLEITKENFKEFHTTIAPPYSKSTTENYSTLKYSSRPKEYSIKHGYEVTEDKNWQEHSPFYRAFSAATTAIKPQTYSTVIPDIIKNNYQETTQFLPTPFIPNSPFPTSPTQAEVSTIYSELTRLNQRPNYSQSNRYNIKDVATHYPIFDVQKPDDQQMPVRNENQYINEITTKKYEEEVTEPFVKPTQETLPPTRYTTRLPQRNRQVNRRRRPTRPTTTTTEIYEPETERYVISTEKPQRRRRPMKYRTTEATVSEYSLQPTTTRPVIRRKPSRPPVTTVNEEVYASENYPTNFRKPVHNVNYEVTSEEIPESAEMVTEVYEAQYLKPKEEKKLDEEDNRFVEYEPTTEYSRTTEVRYYEEPETESTTIGKRKRIRISTTEIAPNTNIKTPENELDYTTTAPITEEPITIKELYQTYHEVEPELTTTVLPTTTTTTEVPTTTKTNRLRRPINNKYDTHRPRFSVKDYRQRLTQYSSTTTESNRITPEYIGKIKYPSRFTKITNDDKEEATESYRNKFKPKDPRHRLATTEHFIQEPTTERIKPNRLRPFNRRTNSSLPSTTSAPRVAIKANIFSNLKRPQPISLRNRIYNKNKNITTTTANNDVMPEEEISTEKTEVTISIAEKIDPTTESYRRSSEKENIPVDIVTEESYQEEEVNDDADAFLQLQRISELTSSSKNNFKTISTPSRHVPNYFTISTDDPILPIEAFFPKLNQRNNEK